MSSSQQFRIELDRRNALRMSCVNANCENERNGFAVVLDPDNKEHAEKLRLVDQDNTRRHIRLRSEEATDWVANHGVSQGITDAEGKLATLLSNTPPGLLVLLFPPGQQCFKPHLDREVIFRHATPRAVRVHERFEDYREHWDEEADRVNRMVQRG